MAKGGARKGAGRPEGSQSKKKVIREQIAAAKGKTPLEVMLEVMEYFLGRAEKTTDEEEKAKLKRAASVQAADAAPYVHSKMPQGINMKSTINIRFDADDKDL